MGFNTSKMDEIFKEWMNNVYQDLPTGTRSEYKKPVLIYLQWLEDGNLLPHDKKMTSSEIHSMVQEHLKTLEHYSKSYVNLSFHAINTLYRFVYHFPLDSRIIKKRGKEQKHQPELLSKNEIDKLLNTENGFTKSTMLELGYHCALRASELVSIKDKNYEDGVLSIKVKKSKREKYKKVGLPQHLQDAIEDLIDEERGYIFKRKPQHDFKKIAKRRWLSGEWSKWFSNYAQSVLGRKVRWHDFGRYTRLTLYAERPDTSFKDVLLLSGHTSPSVCLQYFERAKSKVEGLELPDTPW